MTFVLKQHMKNKKKAIENYIENQFDPIIAHKLFRPKKNNFFNEKNKYINSKVIRKNLEHSTDYLNKKTNNNHQSTGLYHNRTDDPYDENHIDCVEDGFCMNHCRNNETNSSYKYHYNCRYSRCTDYYKNKKMFHGEKKWYSNKFVCFKCRRVITRSSKYKNLQKENILNNWPKCFSCQQHMSSVSVNFEPPPKKNIKHWNKLDKEWWDHCRLNYEEYKNL